MQLQRDDIRLETVRLKVLAAFDDAAVELYGMKLGALDEDLPDLFPAIDRQANRMLERAAARTVQPA